MKDLVVGGVKDLVVGWVKDLVVDWVKGSDRGIPGLYIAEDKILLFFHRDIFSSLQVAPPAL